MLQLSYQAEMLPKDELYECNKGAIRVMRVRKSIVLNQCYESEECCAKDLSEKNRIHNRLQSIVHYFDMRIYSILTRGLLFIRR